MHACAFVRVNIQEKAVRARQRGGGDAAAASSVSAAKRPKIVARPPEPKAAEVPGQYQLLQLY